METLNNPYTQHSSMPKYSVSWSDPKKSTTNFTKFVDELESKAVLRKISENSVETNDRRVAQTVAKRAMNYYKHIKLTVIRDEEQKQ